MRPVFSTSRKVSLAMFLLLILTVGSKESLDISTALGARYSLISLIRSVCVLVFLNWIEIQIWPFSIRCLSKIAIWDPFYDAYNILIHD